ncbi:cytochrome c biogenesis protein ResB [Candidatus Poribacteria bacterium]|nr:cytochrome c biogenesis protein ResB [Candidatus Poribacteria bacterium]
MVDENKATDSGKRVLKKIWSFFCKVKIALSLLIILAIVSILGTVIEQIYYSWWYQLIFLLLIINLLICSIDRLPSVWKIITLPTVEVSNDFIKNNLIFFEEIDFASSRESIKKVLKKYGFNVTATSKGYYCEKGKISRLGPIITHFGIIFILLGSSLSLVFGFKGYIEAPEGEIIKDYYNRKTKKNENLNFGILLNKFNIEYYPRKIVLKIKDISNDAAQNKNIIKYEVYVGQELDLNRKGYKLKVENFVLNYKITDNTFVKQKYSGANSNPAVELSIYKNNELIGKSWFFWGIPEIQDFAEEGYLIRFNKFWSPSVKEYKSDVSIVENGKIILNKTILVNDPLIYKGIAFYQTSHRVDGKAYISNFQVVNEPGIWIIYISFAIVIVGVFLSFYIYHQKIWINIYEKNNKKKLIIGGLNYKSSYAFSNKFKKIVEDIKIM